MKTQANKKCRELNFKVGDSVYVKLRPYRQRTVVKRVNEKLAPRYFSPYPVVARPTQLPPNLTAELEWLLEPDGVLAIRPGTHKVPLQALIKWGNLPSSKATWEDFAIIKDQFLHGGGQGETRWGGIDRPPLTFVYA
uniref:Chromo domain-containing protein n=1 Tax=Cannabis sativa TaxID=3483 RepID=A0A803PLU8_CANSA